MVVKTKFESGIRGTQNTFLECQRELNLRIGEYLRHIASAILVHHLFPHHQKSGGQTISVFTYMYIATHTDRIPQHGNRVVRAERHVVSRANKNNPALVCNYMWGPLSANSYWRCARMYT